MSDPRMEKLLRQIRSGVYEVNSLEVAEAIVCRLELERKWFYEEHRGSLLLWPPQIS